MSSRKFQNVPPYTGNNDGQMLRALGEAVSYITAQSQPAIAPLSTTATTAQIISKINEIVARIQGTT